MIEGNTLRKSDDVDGASSVAAGALVGCAFGSMRELFSVESFIPNNLCLETVRLMQPVSRLQASSSDSKDQAGQSHALL
jgi:hypothetical protein